jgi:hypothetical protein
MDMDDCSEGCGGESSQVKSGQVSGHTSSSSGKTEKSSISRPEWTCRMKSEPERRVPVHRWEQVDRWVQVGASMCCGAVRKRVLKVEGTGHTPVCCTNLRACCCFFEAEENCCHVMVVPGA